MAKQWPIDFGTLRSELGQPRRNVGFSEFVALHEAHLGISEVSDLVRVLVCYRQRSGHHPFSAKSVDLTVTYPRHPILFAHPHFVRVGALRAPPRILIQSGYVFVRKPTIPNPTLVVLRKRLSDTLRPLQAKRSGKSRASNGFGYIGSEGPLIVVGTGSAVSPLNFCLSA